MKRKLLSLSATTDVRWPIVLVGGLVVALAGVLYTFRLGSLIGQGSAEKLSVESLQSFGAIADNPLLLAFKLPAAILMQLLEDPLIAGRLAAIAVAIMSGVLFYILARRWHGRLQGMLSTILFISSSWMLHTGRYAAGYGVLILLVLALLNIVTITNNSDDKHAGRTLLLYAAVSGLALFVPGGIWFALAAFVVGRKNILELAKVATAKQRLTAIGIASAAGLVLIGACLRNPDIIRQSLGLPAAFPGLIDLGKQAALSFSGFVLRGPATPEVWLVHTPVLDVASSALLVIGLIFYSKHLSSSRARLLAAFGLIGVVLVALHGAPALGYLVPLVYIVISAGLAYLFHQWKRVFPRNPIAKAVAIGTFGLLVACMVSFHLQRYFIAWRYNPATVETYRQADSGDMPVPYLIQ